MLSAPERPPSEITPLDRFVEKLSIEPNGCIVWTGCLDRLGYGHVTVERRVRIAHRWFWEQLRGPIPPGLELDHLCRNRACVKLEHLELVTHAENMRRAPATCLDGSRNAAKTHCPRGHPYDAANTYLDPRAGGGRRCRACERELRRERTGWSGLPRPSERTHCPRGHAYDSENTYVTPQGKRMCRTCRRERTAARRR